MRTDIEETEAETASQQRQRRAAILRAAQNIKPVKLRKILVPVDFSHCSLKALRYAAPLAEQAGAFVHLLHAVEPISSISGVQALPLMLSDEELESQARGRLTAIAQHNVKPFVQENVRVEIGRSYDEIVKAARDLDADLIVISTHGFTGIKHVLIGSTTERVVRHAPCPVLVVRVREHEFVRTDAHETKAPVELKKILVTADFSNCSMRALHYAIRFAAQFHASLTLLHVVHLDGYGTSDAYAEFDYPVLVQAVRSAAKQRMRELVSATPFGGVPVKTAVCEGHAVQEICSFAETHNFDLILTATHGYTGFKHILIGSVAEHVVRHAPCPVLVVPSHRR